MTPTLISAPANASDRLTREVIDQIIVVGHTNPDTDASASAAAYAAFLNRIARYDATVTPAVLGEQSPQARFVFESAGHAPPRLVDNVSLRVGHAMTRTPTTLSPEDRVGDAIERLIRDDISMLPVVTEEQKLLGIFSHHGDAAKFLMGFDPTALWGTLITVEDIAMLPGAYQAGRVPIQRAETSVLGDFIVALQGGSSLRCGPDDIVLCGGLECLDKVENDSLPSAVVVVDGSVDQDRVYRLNNSHVPVLAYPHPIASLFCRLAMQIRLGALHLPRGPQVGELDLLNDIQGLLVKGRGALPVVDADERLVGVLSRGDLADPKRARVVLVDHFEKPQSVPGVDEADVLEVLDHHRVGDIQTAGPARIQCRPVGSSCTIVACSFRDSGRDPTKGEARLMMGGLLADTLNLTGPTTTEIDRDIASWLSTFAEVAVDEFGAQVLVAGDDLMTSEPEDIWNRDQKEFSIKNQTFAVAQLETTSLESLPQERLERFHQLVRRDCEELGRLLSLLVLTDVLTGDSWMCSAESKAAAGIVNLAFGGKEPCPNWRSTPGIVSRKKQIVPRLIQKLAE